jgi:hypothetical protein
MKLHLFEYYCRRDGLHFTAPEIVAGYGTFLLRSTGTGEEAYVEAISDDVFAEVGRLVDRLPDAARLPGPERGALTQAVFSVACDPAIDGTPFVIGGKPHCARCGSDDVEFVQATGPPEFIDIDLSHVTHRWWSGLRPEDRRRLVEEAVGHR